MKHVCAERMFHPACAGKDVWQKIPWWFKCLLLNLIQMCPNCSDLRILTYSSCLWMRSRVNWASSKLLDSTSNVKLCQTQGWGVVAGPVLPWKEEQKVWSWASWQGLGLFMHPLRGWDSDCCCLNSQLLFFGNAVLHLWLHPAIQEQTSLSRALGQAKPAAEPQWHCCSQESAARGKCLLCLCLEKAHEGNVSHQENPWHCGLKSSRARASTLRAIGGVSTAQHTALQC